MENSKFLHQQKYKALTALKLKIKKGEQLTKDDLVFLYEINSRIEDFGVNDARHIAEFCKQRNPEEDAPVIFGCEPGQIARKPEDITTDTKAYVGKLVPGIFNKLGAIKYIYSSFHGGNIRKEFLTIGGTNSKELQRNLEQAGFKISGYVRDILNEKNFETLKNTETVELVRLTVKDLGFDQGATLEEIYRKAEELGLDLCPAEVGPQYRLAHGDQPLGDRTCIAMKQISNRYGEVDLFDVAHYEDGMWLNTNFWGADPLTQRYPAESFIFRLPNSSVYKKSAA